jgi:calpain-7
MYPYDHANDRMSISANGKYIFKLYFNGCWRRVEVDDCLPVSKDGRILHVIDRRHPRLLWPALIEKAYLKVRGGYDFPGSNSGTDLAVLTGWIPQQVFLHDADLEPDELWAEVVRHFQDGSLLITLGTGKLSRREQKQLGLAAEHDYAVLEISVDGDTKEMLIKNPWANGDVWTGAARRRSNPRDGGDNPDCIDDEAMLPGTFWMDFNSVFQYYENMYLNWHPGLFSYRQDLHFPWNVDRNLTKSNLVMDNPQFTVEASKSGEVWILLHRHLRTGDYTQDSIGKNGYLSLYLYSRGGYQVISGEGALKRGPYVDSPNTLLRFHADARQKYTLVMVGQDLPAGKLNFTISAFASCPMSLAEAASEYSNSSVVTSGWTRSSSAGNSDSPNYLSNPQFSLIISQPSKIALVLRLTPATDAKPPSSSHETNVKILVVSSDGTSVYRLRPRDVQAHSGDYRQNSAVMETELRSGKYTVICSTFEPNQLAEFSLFIYSTTSSAVLNELPTEGAGRLTMHSAPAVFTAGVDRLLAPIAAARMTRTTFILLDESSTAGAIQNSLFRMTLEQGQGPYKDVLGSSQLDDEEFSLLSSGLRINNFDIQPSMYSAATGGLWLVVERLAQAGTPSASGDLVLQNISLRVRMYTDERLELGAWGRGDG